MLMMVILLSNVLIIIVTEFYKVIQDKEAAPVGFQSVQKRNMTDTIDLHPIRNPSRRGDPSRRH
jgi:hypothetical protein